MNYYQGFPFSVKSSPTDMILRGTTVSASTPFSSLMDCHHFLFQAQVQRSLELTTVREIVSVCGLLRANQQPHATAKSLNYNRHD